jgi:hypothetical protein
MTGFPSPKKKKKLIRQEQGTKQPTKNLISKKVKPTRESVANTSDSVVKTPSTKGKLKQQKIDKYVKKSPPKKVIKKTSSTPNSNTKSKTNSSPARKKSEVDLSRLGKRSETLKAKNYRELESDTESIFEGINMSPKSLKVPYRPKGFILQQAINMHNAASGKSKNSKTDKLKNNKTVKVDKKKKDAKIKPSVITRTKKKDGRSRR